MPIPAAPDGYVKWRPSAVIFTQKCDHWHFENAVGREIPAKPRPADSIYCSTKQDGVKDEHKEHSAVFQLLRPELLVWVAAANGIDKWQ